MALSAKTGNFALNTSTGNQAVTGVGFLPKIVLFFASENTADGVIADQNVCIGAGISSTERAMATVNDEDNVTTTDSSRVVSNVECLHLQSPGSTGTIRVIADLVSLDADGFTIDITTAPGSAHRVGYLALAGDDLTNVAIGTFNPSGSTGNQAVTGIGFQPDAMLLLHNGTNVAAGAVTEHTLGFGWAVSTSERGWIGTASDNGAGTSDTFRRQQTDTCIGDLNFSGGTLSGLADFVSFDADGFTVNWSTAGASGDDYIYIAFKGGQYAAGSLTTQTSTGNFSETGVGFLPSAGIFASFCNAASASTVAGLEMSVGIATSSAERFVVGGVAEDAQGTTDADQFQDDALVYQNYDFAQALEGSIDLVSFDADGFTLDQVDADPSGNEMIYFVIGAAAGGVPVLRRRREMAEAF